MEFWWGLNRLRERGRGGDVSLPAGQCRNLPSFAQLDEF